MTVRMWRVLLLSPFLVVLGVELVSGRTLARGSLRTVCRNDDPAKYWAMVGGHIAAVVVLAILTGW